MPSSYGVQTCFCIVRFDELISGSWTLLFLLHQIVDLQNRHSQHCHKNFFMHSLSLQTRQNLLPARNQSQTCSLANANEVTKNLPVSFLPEIVKILHLTCGWSVDYTRREGLHEFKLSRLHLYIDAMLPIYFLYHFAICKRSLMHIVASGNVQIFVQNLPGKNQCHLWKTRRDALRVQGMPG